MMGRLAMLFDADAVAKVHASAFNAHDMQTLLNHYATTARVLRDGRLVGEGRDAVQRQVEAEYHPGGYVQVRHLDGEPVLAECHGNPEHPDIDAIIRLHHTGAFLDEVRIDHDPALMARLQD